MEFGLTANGFVSHAFTNIAVGFDPIIGTLLKGLVLKKAK